MNMPQQGWGADPLAKIGSLTPTGFGNYFAEGFVGVLVNDSLIGQTSQQQGQHFQVVSEWRVLETNLPEYHPIGAKVSYVMDWKHGDVAATNCQSLLAALYGVSPQDKARVQATLTQEAKYAALDGSQRMRGKVVAVQTSIGQWTRGGPGKQSHPITKVQFQPLEQTKYAQPAAALLASPIVAGKPVPQAAGTPPGGAPTPLSAPPAGFVMPQGVPQPAPAAAAPVLPFAPAAAPAVPQLPFAPPAAAPPPVPPAPSVQQWVTHPDNPAYEYVPGTQQVRQKTA